MKQAKLTAKSLRLAWDASPLWLCTVVVLSFVLTSLQVLMAYLGRAIVNAVVAHSVEQAVHWVLVEVVAVLGYALLQRITNLSRSLLGNQLTLNIQSELLQKSASLTLSQFEDAAIYDRLNRATREVSSRPLDVLSQSLDFFQNVLTITAYGSILFRFNPLLTLLMAAASVPITVMEARFSQRIFGLQNWRSPIRRKLAYIEFLLTRDTNVKEIKVLGLAPHLLERHRRQSENFIKEDREIYVRHSAWSYVLSSLSDFAFYASYIFIVVSAARGKISIGDLTLYSMAFRQGQRAFQVCLGAIGKIYESNLYMSNLFEFLGLPTEEPQKNHASPEPKTEIPKEGIYFDKVGFRYSAELPWALRNVSFHIPRGQRLSLIGVNGAGKSTLVKLLAGLYKATEGRIFIDGEDIRSFAPDEFWRRICIVFQDFTRYQFSLRENLTLGEIHKETSEEQLQRAMAAGGAEDLLPRLGKGMDTQLGRWFAEGTELSGGQWQKVALSRGFIRENAEILILDEPSSSLDADAEYALLQRFQSLAQGKTSIFISHRLRASRYADLILILKAGTIQEFGTPEELLRQGGEYARLAALHI